MKAVVDIGTNSVLLLVARRRADGTVEVVRDEARVTRLGAGVAQSGRLQPAAVERTVAALAEYRRIADDAGAPIEAVATEGVRLATDRDAFLARARNALGRDVRVVTGEEEARLSYLSVAYEAVQGGPLRVVDVGGASTELAAGEGVAVHSLASHAVGSVRLTEACVRHDPPRPCEIEAVEDAAGAAFAAQPLPAAPVLHGLAGTVTTAAALLLGLTRYDRRRVDQTRWTSAQIRELRDALAAEACERRQTRACLPPGRADVIVAGLSILRVAMAHCGADELVARDRGLRYALV